MVQYSCRILRKYYIAGTCNQSFKMIFGLYPWPTACSICLLYQHCSWSLQYDSSFMPCASLHNSVGTEVLTAVRTNMALFWVVAPCSLVDVYQRFRGPCSLHHQSEQNAIALIMEAARTSETLVNFYQTTRRYNPEYTHLPSLLRHSTVFISHWKRFYVGYNNP
jgi:hypothetical protein